MTWGLNANQCGDCQDAEKCVDRAVMQGAITGCHMMPYKVGHMGGGTIEIHCSNQKPIEKKE
jgi:hypothetical protein